MREFVRINYPGYRVVSPSPEEMERRRRRNERRNVGSSDHPESLSVAQLAGKVQRLEAKLSGVYDQINIMKETFKKEMADQERRIKADAEERIKEAEEKIDNLRSMLEMNSNHPNDVEHSGSGVEWDHPAPGESHTDDGNGNVAPLPPGVTPEVLTSMARDWRRLDENYWRRSIMISGIGSPGEGVTQGCWSCLSDGDLCQQFHNKVWVNQALLSDGV